jgi:hypothetical protein
MPENNLKSIEDLIRIQYDRCKNDPVYFIKNFCYIRNPDVGKEKFNLYPFQEKLLRIIVKGDKHSNIIINKSRQLGISTLMAAYCVWEIVFKPDREILVIATKRDVAINLIDKVKYMYDNLPPYLLGDSKHRSGKRGDNIESYNKQSIVLKNKSKIFAVAASSDAGRSYSPNLLIIDEAAHIEDIDTIYTSIKPALTVAGRCIALSSPKGQSNWFYRTFKGAQLGRNTFLPIELKWNVHPDRDETWFARESADMSPQEIAQEFNCDFLASGDTVIDPQYLKLAEQHLMEPVDKMGYTRDLWIWKHPEPGRKYILASDVARGDGSDYSTFHVIDNNTAEQVAEIQTKLSPTDFARVILSTAFMYNEALVVVENNGLSYAVVEQIVNSNYPNMYYTTKGGIDMIYNEFTRKYMNSDKVPGFTNSTRIRPILVDKIKEYFKNNAFTMRSARLANELNSFIWHNGKAQADKGENDDLVIALGIALFIRDTHAEFIQEYDNVTRTMLNNQAIQVPYNNMLPKGNFTHQRHNPYLMAIGNGQYEDFRWVLDSYEIQQ